jgi:hypothetical protein
MIKVTNVSRQANNDGSETEFVGYFYGNAQSIPLNQTWGHTFDFTAPNNLAHGIPLNEDDSANVISTDHLNMGCAVITLTAFYVLHKL